MVVAVLGAAACADGGVTQTMVRIELDPLFGGRGHAVTVEGARAELGAATREATEALTEVPGSTCAGCHATPINPLGFATDGYDALGRARMVEPIFDEEGNLLTESGRVHSCMAREYFRSPSPSFIAFLSQHGGVFASNMYPADATPTDRVMAAEGHHEVRRGALALEVSSGSPR